MIPHRGTIRGARRGPAEVVVHVNEHIATACERDDLVARAAVARVTHRAVFAVESIRETLEKRLDVRRAADRDLPLVALNDVAGLHFRDLRRGTLARRFPATCLELVDAAAMLDACANVRSVHAVWTEQQIGHPLDRRRTVDFEIWNL